MTAPTDDHVANDPASGEPTGVKQVWDAPTLTLLGDAKSLTEADPVDFELAGVSGGFS
jgi:hypothetical protein